ncbi:sugar transferase [Cohaesibacter celericrescens]|uniref:Sugar transferase n=1 Tax=Cohaesibacter celericrescens TaxID=2067669 RepID=A0A2N5XUF1_9HYPH|nr:sugar transferase [Cohaesibacter celericrescens]PLW78146.1 sugar transferase [Cohaesibacter celericrescens]
MKRAFDIVVSAMLLLLTSPILLLVCLAIKLTDKGPALFSQTRVGLNGRLFEIYKFRSMVVNAADLGGFSTADKDPRITAIGRLLRKTSLDELPQLFNVLKGEMSLVGPRPDVPAQRALYTEPQYLKRCSVQPGITGLAQATKRSTATIEERLQLDLDYVDQSSLRFDLWVILLTIKQVIAKGGI